MTQAPPFATSDVSTVDVMAKTRAAGRSCRERVGACRARFRSPDRPSDRSPRLPPRFRRPRGQRRYAAADLERCLGRPHARPRSAARVRRQHLLSASRHACVLRNQSGRGPSGDSDVLGDRQPVRGAQLRRPLLVRAQRDRDLLPRAIPRRGQARGRGFCDLLRVLPVRLRPPSAHPPADDGRTALEYARAPSSVRSTDGRARSGAGTGDGSASALLRLLRRLRGPGCRVLGGGHRRDEAPLDRHPLLDGDRDRGRRGDRRRAAALAPVPEPPADDRLRPIARRDAPVVG